MKKEVIVHNNPKSPISEIFRTLRTNIQYMNTNKKMKTLLITSTFVNEGKSWVTSNLAVTFAQAGKKVVLIDADMRKGRQYSIFGVSPRPGLSNYLSQVEIEEDETTSENIVDYIQETPVENLYVIAAGNVPPNPSELLVSAKMINLLEELKEMCDLVILDGTPCELVTDSIILSRLVDSTIVVTAHKATKKDALERMVKNIRNVGGKLAGVVVNKVPISSRRYGETYYYYGKSHSFSKEKKENNTKKETFKKTETFEKKEVIEETKTENQTQVKSEKPKKETASLDRTNDILKQINEYLEKEKNNLKK